MYDDEMDVDPSPLVPGKDGARKKVASSSPTTGQAPAVRTSKRARGGQ